MPPCGCFGPAWRHFSFMSSRRIIELLLQRCPVLQSTCAARMACRCVEGRSASKVDTITFHRRHRHALQCGERAIVCAGGLQNRKFRSHDQRLDGSRVSVLIVIFYVTVYHVCVLRCMDVVMDCQRVPVFVKIGILAGDEYSWRVTG